MAGAVHYDWPETCGCECLTETKSVPCGIDWRKNPLIRMICVSEFYDHVLQRVAEVPTGMLDNSIVQSASRFCADTRILRRWIKADLQADRVDYTISLTGDEQIAEVHRVCVNDRCLDIGDTTCTSTCDSRSGSFWFQAPATVLISSHVCKDQAEGLAFEVSAMPTRGSSRLDAVLYTHYLDAIVAGAVKILCTTDKKYGFQDYSIAKAAEQDYQFNRSNAVAAFGRARHGPVRKILRGMG